MKKNIAYIIILLLLFSFAACKKIKKDDNKKIVENVTQYSKYGIYGYVNEEDLEKKSSEVKDKMFFDHGSKFTVLQMKNLENKTYCEIQLPDDSKYWVPKDALTPKFIVINQIDVMSYIQPDQDYPANILLQPGDYGTLIEEKDGWYKVSFGAYRPNKPEGERKWIGEKWIQSGFTDDLKTAKEAYYLYLANYYYIGKKNKNKAIEMLNKALIVNGGSTTDITPIVNDYLEELENSE